MEDLDVLARINSLVDEEHHLLVRRTGGGASAEEHQRLARLEVELDECWDLLRQRRARRAAGEDPSGAAPRGEDIVERYQQ
ncbi:MAG: hypothetical protein QOH10_1762 [Actinomycetota bacterium]|jgi:hypothetical protein|nr:hypothetical protein [Actinomycetota bacterium]